MRMGQSFIGRAAYTAVRDPFVHFLVLGLLLFGAYTWLSQDEATDLSEHEIHLTLDDLAQLVIGFEAQWNRSPTQDEFNTLVENRVREDVLYREALSLGLDKEDTIVKRRMAQKMEFLVEDMAEAREPDEAELRSWFEQNSDLFAMPPRLSFRHIYFSPDARGTNAQSDAAAALDQLADQPATSADMAAEGDAFMFQDYYRERTQQAIARDFGPEFAVSLTDLTPDRWLGPVQSGFGWHLVYIDGRTPGRVPSYEEVEREVRTAWLGTRKAEAWTKAYADIRAKYIVLMPVPAEAAATASDTMGGAVSREGEAPSGLDGS